MKTRVKTRGSTVYPWALEVWDPFDETWRTISIHGWLWFATYKAKRLSKKSLKIYSSKKEEFIDRLKGTHKEPSKAAKGCPP